MYGYIYLTTNKINNKKYIGQHRASKFDPAYIGSGVLLFRAIQKYGKENFSTIILEECVNDEELNSKEIYYISKFNADIQDEYYNVAKGGLGHTCQPWNKGKKGVQKITQKQLDALEAGRHLPASQKQKEQLRKRRTGIEVSQATRDKLRVAALKQARPIEKWVWMFNPLTSKYKRVLSTDVNSFLCAGWIRQGVKQHRSSQQRDNYRKASANRKHIHKGMINRNVKLSEYESYLLDGWKDGYYKN